MEEAFAGQEGALTHPPVLPSPLALASLESHSHDSPGTKPQPGALSRGMAGATCSLWAPRAQPASFPAKPVARAV